MCKKHDTKNVLLFLGPKGPLTFGATRQKKFATYRSSHFNKIEEKMNGKKPTFTQNGAVFFSVHVT